MNGLARGSSGSSALYCIVFVLYCIVYYCICVHFIVVLFTLNWNFVFYFQGVSSCSGVAQVFFTWTQHQQETSSIHHRWPTTIQTLGKPAAQRVYTQDGLDLHCGRGEIIGRRRGGRPTTTRSYRRRSPWWPGNISSRIQWSFPRCQVQRQNDHGYLDRWISTCIRQHPCLSRPHGHIVQYFFIIQGASTLTSACGRAHCPQPPMRSRRRCRWWRHLRATGHWNTAWRSHAGRQHWIHLHKEEGNEGWEGDLAMLCEECGTHLHGWCYPNRTWVHEDSIQSRPPCATWHRQAHSHNQSYPPESQGECLHIGGKHRGGGDAGHCGPRGPSSHPPCTS